MKGLLAEGHLSNCEISIDNYLKYAHDIPIHTLIKKDEELRNMILSMDSSIPRYIFTERCLKALGIIDLFQDIINVNACCMSISHETFD